MITGTTGLLEGGTEIKSSFINNFKFCLTSSRTGVLEFLLAAAMPAAGMVEKQLFTTYWTSADDFFWPVAGQPVISYLPMDERIKRLKNLGGPTKQARNQSALKQKCSGTVPALIPEYL